MRTPRFALVAVLLPGVAPALAAQALTISLGGITSANVATVRGGARVPIGSVTADGSLTIDQLAAINAVKGQQVRSYFDNPLRGTPSFVFVPDGERDARCDDVAPRSTIDLSQDACGLITVFRAGQSAQFGARASGGVVQLTTKTPPPVRFLAGMTYGRASFGRLDQVACDMTAISGLTGCDAESTGSWFGASVGTNVIPKVQVGLSYRRSSYGVNQQYGGTPVRHTVTVHVVQPYVQVPLLDGPVEPFVYGGPALYLNKSRYGPAGGTLTQSRSESGLRIGGGGGVRCRVGGRFLVQGLFGYDTGGKHDADTNTHWGVGLSVRF